MRLSTPPTQDMQCTCTGCVFLGLKSLLDIYFCERSCFVCRLLRIGFVLCHQHKNQPKAKRSKTQRMWDTKNLICQPFNLRFFMSGLLPLRFSIVSNVRQKGESCRVFDIYVVVFDFCVQKARHPCAGTVHWQLHILDLQSDSFKYRQNKFFSYPRKRRGFHFFWCPSSDRQNWDSTQIPFSELSCVHLLTIERVPILEF